MKNIKKALKEVSKMNNSSFSNITKLEWDFFKSELVFVSAGKYRCWGITLKIDFSDSPEMTFKNLFKVLNLKFPESSNQEKEVNKEVKWIKPTGKTYAKLRHAFTPCCSDSKRLWRLRPLL